MDTLVSTRIAKLSDAKRLLLEKRLSGAAAAGDCPELVSLSPRPQFIPLSYPQQRLWFIDQLEHGGSTQYNLPAAFRLTGNLDVKILVQAIQAIVDRHEILRTRFVPIQGSPAQMIEPRLTMEIPLHDISSLDADSQKTFILTALERERQQPFDLEHGPLLRVKLLKLKEQEHILLRTTHHIVFDGWSDGIFNQELSALYQAFQDGRENPLLRLELQYADFAIWQRQAMEAGPLEEGLRYWKQKLAGIPTHLNLPTDRLRPARQTFRAKGFYLKVPETAAAELKKLTQESRTTLYMSLLAAFGVLLSRYSGEADVVVGSPIANRNDRRLEQMIGFFITVLAMRLQISGTMNFLELLRETRKTALEAYQHQDVPFERIVDEISPQRSLSRTPLFQVLFAMQNAPWEAQRISGLQTERITGEDLRVRYDMEVHAWEDEGEIWLRWLYNCDLFDSWRIEQMSRHFIHVLEAAAAAPQKALGEIDLLTAEERLEILEGWNQTSADYPRTFVHQLIAEQAARTPERVVADYEGQQLTYGELNRRANQLSRYLVRLGAGPETRVAICMERSLEMLVTLLAVLKSGAAYVPLDPSYPVKRLQYIFEDAEIGIFLTQASIEEHMPAGTGTRIIVDERSAEIDRESSENPDAVAFDHLAYVIYTSGSTGNPRGVQVSHHALTNFLLSMQREPGISELDVLLAVTTLSFDIAGLELYLPMIAGARVKILDRAAISDPRQLLDAMQEVTVMQATPGTWQLVLQAGWSGSQGIKALCGGEALNSELAGKLVRCSGSTWNMYGPTETTIWSSTSSVQAGEEKTSLGRPIANTKFFVLDEWMKPVPRGVCGELYIGGEGLARGYWKRGDLTAERFVPDPFSVKGGERLYRSGDLARYSGEGRLEYLGRCDQQVKVRGYRVELKEIEAALQGHENVKQAAVLVQTDDNGAQLLVAYVAKIGPQEEAPAAETAPEIDAGELRKYLQGILPEYMIPGQYVWMQQLPLLPNGKLDRNQLPNLATLGRSGREYVAPRSEVEKSLCGIWQEVLRQEKVGIEDNFFELGGDSIRAITVIYKSSQLGINIKLVELFEQQTISALAGGLAPALSTAHEPDPIASVALLSANDRALLPEDVEDAYPLNYMQMGMVYHNQLGQKSGLYHDVFSHHIRISEWNPEVFREVLDALAAKHPVLRTSLSLDAYSEPLQMVHRKTHIPVEFHDLSGLSSSLQEETLQRWREEEQKSSFVLSHAPLLRIFIHRRSTESFQYTLSFHHAILDGWSVGLFQMELFREYTRRTGEQAKKHDLAPLRSTFKRAIAREKLSLASEATKSFWSAYLQGWSTPFLPALKPKSSSGEVRRFVTILPAGLKTRLFQVAAALHVPLRTLFLAAHLRIMAFFSGEKDAITGLVCHSRLEEWDGENVLGMFINILPFRQTVRVSTWSELVRQTYARELEIMPHRHYPYAEIFIQNDRIPLFETGFNYTDFHVYAGFRDLNSIEFLGGSNFEATDLAVEVNVIMRGEDGALNLAYDAIRFSSQQIEQLAGYYSAVLQSMAASPDSGTGLQAILSEAQFRQVLYEWHGQTKDMPAALVPDLFEQQVERTPDAVALSYEDRYLSYGGLNEQANQFAHYLISEGRGPEDLIGIYLPRSLEIAVVMLGILKAGAAFLPFDPEFPQGRVASILKGANPALVVSTRKLQRSLPRQVLSLDIEEPGFASALRRMPADNPVNRERKTPLLPRHLAYVIYTSGSTGEPKGAAIEHGGMLNHMLAKIEDLALNERDIMGHTATIVFDVAIWQLWAALLAGGRVHIINGESTGDVLNILRTLHEREVSVLETVPSVLTIMLDAAADEGWPSLRHTIANGEPLTNEMYQRWRRMSRAGHLWNMYGVTECSDDATHYRVEGESREGDVIAVGQALRNTELYLLDDALEPVPSGMPGELYIGGAGVGRGYFRQPGHTADRFIGSPFGKPGSRIYRTGDRMICRPDGVLRFLGRTDHQVKLRGFRIELGEIESALRQQTEVRDAVALIREEKDGDKRVVAYVVPATDSAIDPQLLRRALGRALPEHMVPAAIVVLDAFPLTLNGKLDRKALPSPEYSSMLPYRPARTAQEEVLCSLFAEVLGIEQPGIDDNFFQLGGHSLSAMRLVSRIRSTLALELSIKTFFEAPTVAGLSARLRDSAKGREPLIRQPRPQALPLSHAQERLWFIDQLEAGRSTQYHIPLALRLRGKLDTEALEKAFHAILERHESLRTRFIQVNGEALQVIEPYQAMPIELEDLSALDAESQRLRVSDALNQEWEKAFDLEHGAGWRVKLLKLNETEHVLLRTTHHIVSDEWSEKIFDQEFGVLYEAFLEKRQNPLPPLQVQYADFAIWQRRWLQQGVLQKGLNYWRQQLAGIPEHLELSKDTPPSASPSFDAQIHEIEVPAGLLPGLKRLTEQGKATLYMSLLAALGVLLSRYSSQQEVVVGSPVADRQDPQLEELIGLFINLLALRMRVPRQASFLELLDEVRKMTLEAYQHQYVPFEQVVDEVCPRRSLSRTPLFQVVFSVHTAMREGRSLKGLEVERILGEGVRTRHDIEVHAWEGKNRLWVHWLYKRDLFSARQMNQMAQHYVRVLEAVVAAPEQALEEIDLLTAEERRMILEEWNRTAADYPQMFVHRRIEEQAARTPERVAVDYEGQHLTYGELNRRANQLARHLLKIGVKAESRVGICLERSMEMLVALLGVMKAGAAYIPLDPENPKERLRFMIEESQITVVLLQQKFVAKCPPHLPWLIKLDTGWEVISREDDEDQAILVESDNAAYVIYTSGSTGRPKGAMNTHRGLENRLVWMQEKYRLGGDDRVLQKTPFGFDVSVWEFFLPLIAGAELVVARPEGHRDPFYLANLIQQKEVSTLHFVPSMLAAFLDAGREQGCGSVRRIFCSGEALQPELARRCKELFNGELHNLYGPTETAIDVSWHECTLHLEGTVPVGRPIANTRMYVLDQAGQAAPVLVPGELYIGGVGLGRGYVNRPELTAERFVPDHVSGRAGERLYRTGDVARWREDGALEYLGRTDHQVKIRGYRIELGEIESALRRHPAVNDALVTAGDYPGCEKRLIAYVVAHPDKAVAGGTGSPQSRASAQLQTELPLYLAQGLPEYMLPSAFVFVDSFPLLSNGKLDRQALPAPEFWTRNEYVPPQTPQEAALCGAFAEVLRVERVGVDDNFFELGGNSISSIRAVTKLRDAGVMITLRDFFHLQTARNMAAVVNCAGLDSLIKLANPEGTLMQSTKTA
ncbi:MAG TPA: amino acid adenylation domain-containing protein [Candidatus Angelobacter sp.]|jgi:amino acid adenylation domain-containing protein